MTLGGDERNHKALVEEVLRELREAADIWEQLVTESENITFSVDIGGVHAVANTDGRLVDLLLDPHATNGYSHVELADRLNVAFAALRKEAKADNQARYGGPLR